MSETNTVSPYLTTKEVADLIRSTPDAVRMMRHRGTGPKGTRVGRRVLYHLDDVHSWLAARDVDDLLRARAAA